MPNYNNKFLSITVPAEGVDGPTTAVVDMLDAQGFDIVVTFDVGSSGTLSLSSSADGSVWVARTNTDIVVGVTDTAHGWGDSNWQSRYLRVNIPAGVTGATVMVSKIKLSSKE